MIDETKLIEDLKRSYLENGNCEWNDAIDRAISIVKASPKVDYEKKYKEKEKVIFDAFKADIVRMGEHLLEFMAANTLMDVLNDNNKMKDCNCDNKK